MIAGGTILGGRYLIEGERRGDHGDPPSWWAVDRQLHRRVAVVVVAGGTSPLDVARRAHLDVSGGLLDGGEHEGEAYLVIRVEGTADAASGRADVPSPLGSRPPPGPAPKSSGRPVAPAVGVLMDRARLQPGDPFEETRMYAGGPGPVVHPDATDAVALPRPVTGLPGPNAGPDPTMVQPLPTAAGSFSPTAGDHRPPPPPGARSGPTRGPGANQAVLRTVALGAAALVLGAGAVVAAAVLASPQPQPPTVPAGVAIGDQEPESAPDRTLPGDPGPSPTTPTPLPPPTSATTATTVSPPASVEPAEPAPPTRGRKPTTTRKRRWPFTFEDRALR